MLTQSSSGRQALRMLLCVFDRGKPVSRDGKTGERARAIEQSGGFLIAASDKGAVGSAPPPIAGPLSPRAAGSSFRPGPDLVNPVPLGSDKYPQAPPTTARHFSISPFLNAVMPVSSYLPAFHRQVVYSSTGRAVVSEPCMRIVRCHRFTDAHLHTWTPSPLW
ncbi:uncharacterized protein LY79DRAFT_304531 [Colletotrichum navitas]|uniref:Uncharacterized protein n=1 Tax=Colletotrichum navitas TaxID=681940 RepID=A0AAD8PTQ9_9PEZI|nr:uncharacterized protein LY79DRAFT_304531 [Colletotrichum navitas]KAK1580555.1 hypothetical protein LY79DRAFT_304531 [Colletotrichum navitas]